MPLLAVRCQDTPGAGMVIHDTTHGLAPLWIDRNAATLSIAWTCKP